MASCSGCWFRGAAGRGRRCLPLCAAQAPGCSIGSGPCAARGSSPRELHKSPEQKAAPAFCAFPVRAAPAARGLTGALSPGAARLLPSAAPVPAHAGRSGACALCLATTLPGMSTIQNLRRPLIRNWRPVCRAVGAAVLGPSPPLPPPAGLGRSAACELFSGLARSLCSANGGNVFGPVNFLSLFCCPTV